MEMSIKKDIIIKFAGLIIMVSALLVNAFIEKILSPDGTIQSIRINSFILVVSMFILFLGLYIFLKPEKIIQCFLHINPLRLYKNKKKELLLFFAVFLLCFAVLEITARLTIPERMITKYGWTTMANASYTAEFDDEPNVTRNITVTYYDFGFKRWGNVNTNKTKVFIIGDSITSMHFVSNSEEWYAYLEKEFPDAEFFVYGGSGYGSLQEYLVLDDFIDIIMPDIILWQFSANDFINNVYEYERKNFVYANRAFRPYLEDGEIVYKIPLPFGVVRRYSYFLNFLLERYDSFVFEIEYARIQFDNQRIRRYFEEQEEAFEITAKIMQMTSKRAGDVPVYFFSSSPLSQQEVFIFPNLDEQVRLICQNANLVCIFGVAEYINEKESQGFIVKVADGHWNVLGNKLAGQYITDYFKKENFKKKDTLSEVIVVSNESK